jgi:GDP-L-fucose synthase
MHGQDVVLLFASKIAGLAYNTRHPWQMMMYNTVLDLHVIDAAVRQGVPLFFYPSGALVYDEAVDMPITETASSGGSPVAACQGAAWAKRAAEAAIRCCEAEHDTRFVVARLSNVYGPGDDFAPETAHLIGNTIGRLARGDVPRIVDGEARRAYLYVDDAVRAILGLVEMAPAGPVNVGGQEEVPVREVVRLVTEVAGGSVVPAVDPSAPVGWSRKALDVTRLRSLIGFEEAISLREGLRRTYEWYRLQSVGAGGTTSTARPR